MIFFHHISVRKGSLICAVRRAVKHSQENRLKEPRCFRARQNWLRNYCRHDKNNAANQHFDRLNLQKTNRAAQACGTRLSEFCCRGLLQQHLQITRQICGFWSTTNNRVYISFRSSIDLKTVHTNPVIAYFSHIEEQEQYGTITKCLRQRAKLYFEMKFSWGLKLTDSIYACRKF